MEVAEISVRRVDTGVGNTHAGDVDTKTHDVDVFEGAANVVAVYSPAR